jgi:hypothetical protein
MLTTTAKSEAMPAADEEHEAMPATDSDVTHLSFLYFAAPDAELNQVLGTPDGLAAVETHSCTIALACAIAWWAFTITLLVAVALLLLLVLLLLVLLVVVLLLLLRLVLVELVLVLLNSPLLRVTPSYNSSAAAGSALPTNPICELDAKEEAVGM